MTALLELERIAFVGDGTWLLRDVSLRIDEGATVALVGGAAAGKSLVLAIILGLAQPRSGMVRLAGRDLRGLEPDRRQSLGLRAASQTPPGFPGFTVREELDLAAKGGRLEPRQVQKLLDYLPELEAHLDGPAWPLSPPLRRLVDLARALLGLPRLLLIDNLFPAIGVARASELVERLAGDGFTMLLADRYGEAALRHAQYGYVLAGGRIQDEGLAADLMLDERLLASCAGDPDAYAP